MKNKQTIKEKDKTHFVFGYRDFSKVPFRHRIANMWWNLLFNIWVRRKGETRIKDVCCGYIALSPKAVKYLVRQKDWEKGYNIDSWIKLKALEFNQRERLNNERLHPLNISMGIESNRYFSVVYFARY